MFCLSDFRPRSVCLTLSWSYSERRLNETHRHLELTCGCQVWTLLEIFGIITELRLSCCLPLDSTDTSLSPGVCDTVLLCPPRGFSSHWECFRSRVLCLPGVVDFSTWRFFSWCLCFCCGRAVICYVLLVSYLSVLSVFIVFLLCCAVVPTCNAAPLSDFLYRSAPCWLTLLWSASVRNRLLGRSWTTGGISLSNSSFEHCWKHWGERNYITSST